MGAGDLPHQDMVTREISEILKVEPGKPEQHQSRVTSYSDELVQIMNECATFKYNFAQKLDSAAVYFLYDNVGLCGISTYFKVLAVAKRADGFNELDFIAKRGGVPELGPIASFPSEKWSREDHSDVLYAFVSALACAKVGLHISNKGFAAASKSNDAEAAKFTQKSAFAYSELVRELSHFVTHLKLVEKDKHAIKNFDRELASSPKIKDLQYAAAIEAVSPSYLQVGVETRKLLKKATCFEESLLAVGTGKLGASSD